MQPTTRLFWKTPYKAQFSAMIVDVGSDCIALDQTLFYPVGGGQASDLGFLNVLDSDSKIMVTGVEKDDNEIIWHKIPENDLQGLSIGEKVVGIIDWDRRYHLMRSHSSQHVLSAVIFSIANIQTRQAMIDMSDVKIILEDAISDKDLIQALISSNEICISSHPVLSKIITSNEAKTQLSSMRRQQIPPGEEIRVVEIPNYDKMCCSGTHTRDTIEIGTIHLTDRKPKILTYVVGRQSLERMVHTNLDVLYLARILNVRPQKIVETTKARLTIQQLLQEQRNEAISAYLSYRVGEEGLRIGEITHRKIDLRFSDRKIALRELGTPEANQVVSVLIENGIFLILSNSKYAAKDLMTEFCQRTGSKGGGSARQAQCSVQVPRPHSVLEEILREYES